MNSAAPGSCTTRLRESSRGTTETTFTSGGMDDAHPNADGTPVALPPGSLGRTPEALRSPRRCGTHGCTRAHRCRCLVRGMEALGCVQGQAPNSRGPDDPG